MLSETDASTAPPNTVRRATAKVALVGDSGVGKTGLGWRIAHGVFKDHPSTHGQQFWLMSQLAQKRDDGVECEAVLWDFAGQHVYRPIHAAFLDDVDVCLIVFDPTNRIEPLKGVEHWLAQIRGNGSALPPAVLVGARLDRGGATLGQDELRQFCAAQGISGGYIGTSAIDGTGISALIGGINQQINWPRQPVTVTTDGFKRVKEHVLALKEQHPEVILLRRDELRRQVESADRSRSLTDAEIATAVQHLRKHGVWLLDAGQGMDRILLSVEVLIKLASSIVLRADTDRQDLGTVDEEALISDNYGFPELEGLEPVDRRALLQEAARRLLSHNICFRERLGSKALLIFPGLIKEKRPLIEKFSTVDDVSYVVRGEVANVYAALVVLIGYTPAFTRINQWHNQAQFELGPEQICGFRMIEEREGEIELILYYGTTVPDTGRSMFKAIFERFLYERNVSVTKYPPVHCPGCKQIQQRAVVMDALRRDSREIYCFRCGSRIDLSEATDRQAVAGAVLWEQSMARLRNAYEAELVTVKGLRADRRAPRCTMVGTADMGGWSDQLRRDLGEAGIVVSHDDHATETDCRVVLATPSLKSRVDTGSQSLARDSEQSSIITLLVRGSAERSIPSTLAESVVIDFRNPSRYSLDLFDLVLALYAIPVDDAQVKSGRSALHRQWNATLQSPAAEVFMSYAWGGDSEITANEIETALQTRGLRVVRDKRDLGYRDRIKAFMDAIGAGQHVILVISDKYLKSPNCLYELVHVAQHGQFVQRVLPVVLADAHIHTPEERIKYQQHWNERVRQFFETVGTLPTDQTPELAADIVLFREIRQSIGGLMSILADIVNRPLTAHRDSDFEDIYQAVMRSQTASSFTSRNS